MNDEREAQAGAPIEETGASVADVQAAVERAGEVGPSASEAEPAAEAAHAAPATEAAPVSVDPELAADPAFASDTAVFSEPERPTVAFAEELPSAGPAPTTVQPEAPTMMAPTMAMPAEAPVRDGEIRISADHPMAALYMQAPMPPDMRGNRGAGVLIALLATIGFAAVLAGVIALLLAPELPPSRFVDGLVDQLVSWQMLFSVVAFFIGLVIAVLIVGKAGWWAYVLGGFLVALLTWAGAVAGAVVDDDGIGALTKLNIRDFFDLAIFPTAIAAFIVAREATIWFGAWIGNRGRRVKRLNAEAIAEYETALAEAQASQS